MQVVKTLVIGLGSTGTEICERVAERIRWELGSLQRVPWVRFLCVETDMNNRPDIIPYEDFVSLTISAQEYSLLLKQPDAYEEKMHLTKWADMETLRRIPDQAVTAGAGNIRMVGRLAFLFPSNYMKIHQGLIARLNWLRTLTVAEAQDSYGPAADGQVPDIQFANGGFLVIYVVGTLCGGTCSGLASDFGFFLGLDTSDSEHKIAIFTIPHPGLTSTIEGNAQRFKKNAYAALVELNQYHLTDRADGRLIMFPDGRKSLPSKMPYDLLFITAPRQVGAEFNQQLNAAIADYIFLNAFVPETLPTGEGVNAPVYHDLGNHAHVFCTFGLSTLEFPAQRVIEACSYQLSAYSLGQWLNRSVEEETIKEWLDAMGLTWERLKSSLFTFEGVDLLARLPQADLDEVTKQAERDPNKARQAIKRLRDPLLIQEEGEMTPDSPGGLYRIAMKNRQAVANEILNNVQNRVRVLLADYRYGPAVARSLLVAIEKRLDEIGVQAIAVQAEPLDTRPVDDILRRIEQYLSGSWWHIWLRRLTREHTKTMKILISRLIEALQGDIQSRADRILSEALNDRKNDLDRTEHGIITRVRKEIDLYKKRIVNLQDRAVTLRNRLDEWHRTLAREEPGVNGVVLFEPEYAGEGTVADEFRRCLELDAGGTGTPWQEHREYLASEIVTNVLSRLSEAVLVPSSTPREKDWLMQPMDPKRPNTWLSREIHEQLLERAQTPFFRRLRSEDVLDRWMHVGGTISPEALLRQATEKAKIFLDVDEAHATYGGRSPIRQSRLVLVPHSPRKTHFVNIVSHEFSNPKVEEAPDPYRVIFVQNWFRFPLRGVLSVVGDIGISRANCNDFPIFFTRKDVAWVGVTDEESKRVRKAEDLVAIANLLEIIYPEKGAIVFDLGIRRPGDPGIRRLPLSFRHAAMSLARGEVDMEGFPLYEAMKILEHRITSERQKFRDKGGDLAFIQYLNKQLTEKVGGVVPDWDERWLADHLTRYCAHDQNLLSAYNEVFPPPRDTIERMRFKVGDRLPGTAGTCKKDGFYCLECGGWIGEDEQEAAQNEWRCFVNPKHAALGPEDRKRV